MCATKQVPKIEDPYLGPHMLLSFQYLHPITSSPKNSNGEASFGVLISDNKRMEEETPTTKPLGLEETNSLNNRAREQMNVSAEYIEDNGFVADTEMLMDEKQLLKYIGQVCYK